MEVGEAGEAEEGGMRRDLLTALNRVKRWYSAQVLATLQRLAMMPRTWRVLEVGLGDRPMVRTTYSTGGDREFKGKGKGAQLVMQRCEKLCSYVCMKLCITMFRILG